MTLRFPLPKEPPQLIPVFQKLCQVLPPEQIGRVQEKVDQFFQKIERDANNLVGPNIRIAEEIKVRVDRLLEEYSSFSDAERALVIGAVMYFVAEKDFVPDHTPIVGFDDDVQVLNHVLEQLAREDQYIEVD